MAEEKIDVVKAVTSPFTALFWVKCVMFGLGIAFLVMVGYGVYKAYFKKPEPTQTQKIEQITVEKGGNVILQKTDAPKKRFIMFVEPWGGVSNRNDKGEIGIRGGCRWEF